MPRARIEADALATMREAAADFADAHPHMDRERTISAYMMAARAGYQSDPADVGGGAHAVHALAAGHAFGEALWKQEKDERMGPDGRALFGYGMALARHEARRAGVN